MCHRRFTLMQLGIASSWSIGFSPGTAWAHTGRAQPGSWWWAWNADPLLLLTCFGGATIYMRGRARLKTRAIHRCPPSALWAGVAGLFALLLALASPLDPLSDELASLHMLQHMLLMVVAAPLIVLAGPHYVWAWGLTELSRGPWARGLRWWFRVPAQSLLWNPWFAWFAFALAIWGWHHPRLYEAALRDPLVHDAEHLSFFVAAFVFWRVVLDPISARRMEPLWAVGYLFTTALHASLLGIYLTFSPDVWYTHYFSRTDVWGLTPLEDQQLAGLLMWLPGCLVFPLVAAIAFGNWLARMDVPSDRSRQNKNSGHFKRQVQP